MIWYAAWIIRNSVCYTCEQPYPVTRGCLGDMGYGGDMSPVCNMVGRKIMHTDRRILCGLWRLGLGGWHLVWPSIAMLWKILGVGKGSNVLTQNCVHLVNDLLFKSPSCFSSVWCSCWSRWSWRRRRLKGEPLLTLLCPCTQLADLSYFSDKSYVGRKTSYCQRRTPNDLFCPTLAKKIRQFNSRESPSSYAGILNLNCDWSKFMCRLRQ